jgi:hypothetical protein
LTPSEPATSGPRSNTANVAPTALFTVSPRWPRPGDTVTVDASYSLDRDGSVVHYEWDLGNGATQVAGTQAKTVYASAGSYPLSVTVVDDSGSRSTRTLSLVVSPAGAPSTAVDSAQSLVVAANTSLLAAATTVVTVTTRTALGLPVPNVPVWLSGRGREWRVTQPSALTTTLGVTTGTIGSSLTQSAQIVAIADYTLLRPVNVSIGATTLSLTRSSLRLTDPVISAPGDSTLLEVTARDAEGNPLVGATVSVAVTGGTSTVRNEGATDANGRRVVVIEPTTCGGALLTVTASVSGTPLTSTASVTAAAPAVYGACGAALWYDADDAATITQSGGVLTGWRDKSGYGRDAVASVGPQVVSGGLNGRTVLRFNGTSQFIPITSVIDGRDYTVLAVERRRSSRGSNYFIGGTTVGNTNLVLGYRADAVPTLTHWNSDLNGTTSAFSTIATQPARLWTARWSSGARSLQLNRATTASDAVMTGVPVWSAPTIGRVATLDRFFDGDIAEVLFFSRALTDSERATLGAALMRKWALGTLALVAGNNQSAAVGSEVATAPQVRVTDGEGNPIVGATVSWQVTAGGGSVASTTSLTDATGAASIAWTLGAGTNTLRATYGTQTADFTATASTVCVSSSVICDPALWVDATDASTITTTSGSVTEWRDKSGWGRHFTATGASAPTVQNSPLTLKNMIRFDGTDVMTLADRPWSGTGAYTLVVVERRRATGAAAFFGRAAANADPVPILGYSSSTAAYVSHGSSPLTGTVSAFTSMNVQATRVWSVQYANGTRTLRVNNAILGTDNAVGSVNTFGGATLGRHNTEWYNGDIGEVVLIPRAVSNADLQTYTLSLMAKWGAGVLTIEAGNSQTADAGTSPATAPRIRLSDGNGNGIPGVNLAWQVTAGGGRVYSLQSFTAQTNATGYADIPSGNWRLDNGTNQLTLWQSGTVGEGPNVVFTATGQLPGTRTLHLDAQDASSFTLNGATRVATWRDRAGSARTVAQSAVGLQPTLSATGINGRPAVVFDGTNDVLIGNTVAYGLTGPRSVFVVTRTTGTVSNGGCTDGAGQYLMDRNPSADQPLTSIKAVGGRWVVQTRLDNGGNLGCAPATSGVTITTNATTIIGMVQTTTAITVFGNGTSVGTLNVGSANTMQPIALGRHGNQGTNPSLAGAVGEVLVFPSALSTTDRQIVERYLGWKWGVTVP